MLYQPNSRGYPMNESEVRPISHHWTILLLSMAASAVLAVLRGQDSGFDLLNYHFYSGFAFLYKPFGYDFAPAQIQSFHNPLVHVLSYFSLGNMTARAAAAFLGALQGLNIYLVFQACPSGRGRSRIPSVIAATTWGKGPCATTSRSSTSWDSPRSEAIAAG